MSAIEFLTPKASASGIATNLLLVGVFEKEFSGAFVGLNTACGGRLAEQSIHEQFDAKVGRDHRALPGRRLRGSARADLRARFPRVLQHHRSA
jgi:hypothetical protein